MKTIASSSITSAQKTHPKFKRLSESNVAEDAINSTLKTKLMESLCPAFSQNAELLIINDRNKI